MTKHTPGPWRLLKREGSFPPVVQRGLEGGFSVAGSNPDTEDADARLIAAAPELLAVLRQVADYWAGGDVPEDIDDAMRAAIAKAEGQQ